MEKTKKLRIKSKKRFAIFILFLIAVSAVIFMFTAGVGMAFGTDHPNCVEITVAENDSLWSIASQYNSSGTDIREMIYDIKAANDMTTSDIQVGDKLIIPLD